MWPSIPPSPTPNPTFSGTQDSSAALVATLTALNNILSKLQQTVAASFPQALGTASTATGGAATLPGNPVGFVIISDPITGVAIKLAYYAD